MWKRLDNFLDNLENKNTAERYFKICEQMGELPNPDKIPVDWDDIPYVAQEAINLYNHLGDRVISEIGFIGKDYTSLPILLDLLIASDTELIMEIILWIEARSIRKSSEAMKKERDKLKRKNTGGSKRSYSQNKG